MQNGSMALEGLNFFDLEDRFGLDNACAILRTLEEFEGISEVRVAKLTYAERLQNVMSAMKDSVSLQTQH